MSTLTQTFEFLRGIDPDDPFQSVTDLDRADEKIKPTISFREPSVISTDPRRGRQLLSEFQDLDISDAQMNRVTKDTSTLVGGKERLKVPKNFVDISQADTLVEFLQVSQANANEQLNEFNTQF